MGRMLSNFQTRETNMRIVTTETKVYTYDELGNDAKERARSAYLETSEPYVFTDMVIADFTEDGSFYW